MERPDPGTAELTESPQAEPPLTEPPLNESAQTESAQTEPMVEASPSRARRRPLLPYALGMVLCALLAGVVLTVLDDRSAQERSDARQAALQAARQQAVNLTTISYETADRDLARIIAAATGTLKTQFEAQAKSFPGVLRQEKSVSVGRVLAAGVKSQQGSTVDALIAVDATVRNAASGDAGVVKHYRMDMRLILVGKRWLVSTVAFAGLPQ